MFRMRRFRDRTGSPDRDALVGFCRTFMFVKHELVDDFDKTTTEELGALAQELAWRALSFGGAKIIAQASTDSWFQLDLNGVTVQLPRYTLMTMRHCIHYKHDGTFQLLVETEHWRRILGELSANSVFLDVGAAAGTMSVPYALTGDPSVRIFAFEPSRRARQYLQATIERNHITNVTVLPFAVSDTAGHAAFIEFPEDDTGRMPYLPEASRLGTADESLHSDNQVSYPVEVTTLDAMLPSFGLAPDQKLVVKIDVEGFEDKVLVGGHKTLSDYRPFLSIDIHVHPGTSTLTDSACMDALKPYGYRFERQAHVLFALPI